MGTVRIMQQRLDQCAVPLLQAIRCLRAEGGLSARQDALTEAAGVLAQSDRAALYLQQQGILCCVAVWRKVATPPTLDAALPMVEHWPPLRQMRATQEAVCIPDTDAHPSWADMLEAMPGARGMKTWIALPLLHDGRMLGFLDIGYVQRTDYRLGESNVLVEFASFAAQAVAQSMALAEEQARARYALMRTSIAEALRDTRQTTALTHHAVSALTQALECSWGALYFALDEGVLSRRTEYLADGHHIDQRLDIALRSILSLMAHQAGTLVVSNLKTSPKVEASVAANRELLLAAGVEAMLISTLSPHQQVQGALVLVQMGASRIWNDGEVMLVEQVAMDVALAVEQSRLIAQLEARSEVARNETDALVAAANHAPIGVVVADSPPDGLRFWNSAAVMLAVSGTPMGAKRAETPRFEPYYPDGKQYPIDQWPLSRALIQAATVPPEESLLRRRDGRLAPVLVSATPTTDADGRVTGSVAVIQDLSEQRQTEARAESYAAAMQALRKVTARAAASVEDLPATAELLREVLPFDAFALVVQGIGSDAAEQSTAWIAPTETPEARSSLTATLGAWRVVSTRIVANLVADPQSAAPQLATLGLRSAIAVPLDLTHDLQGSVGFFCRETAAYTDETTELATVAAHVLVLLWLQRLRADEVQQAASRDERERMAREIHDTLAQMITSVVLQLEQVLQSLPQEHEQRATLDQARDTARAAIAETRRIVWNLKAASAILDDPSSVVTEEAAKLERRMGVKPAVVITGEQRPLAPEVGAVIQRLARVALDNVWSHSEATHVRIVLDYGLHAFTLLIEDDGLGFDPAEADLMGPGRVGLAGVAERSRQIGGTLRVESAAGNGTRVWCVAPYTSAMPGPRTRAAEIPPLPVGAPESGTGPAPTATGTRIRVLLIDDHAMVREGLEHMLRDQPDLEVVGGAGTGSEGLRLISDLRPDVVLCDLQLPDISGVEVISRVRTLFPEIRCVIVTTYDHDDYIYEGIKSGAKGYVLKDVSSAELAAAVRAAARDESLLQPVVAGKLLHRFGEMARQSDMVEPLTEREIGVLRSLATGSRNKEIALQLSLSESTIKTHLASIFGKLGVTTRTEAVTRGRELGLIPL